MKIQDYLPFYIGCKCVTPDGIGTLVGLPWGIMRQDMVHIHFGKGMIKTINSIDGGYDKVRNHGDYLIEAKRYEPIGSKGITDNGFDVPGGIKPILNRLEDMDEIIALELVKLQHNPKRHKDIEVLDVNKDRVNYIDGTLWYGDGVSEFNDFFVYFNQLSPSQTHYLLQQYFDLFGLIDAGIAVDAKTLK